MIGTCPNNKTTRCKAIFFSSLVLLASLYPGVQSYGASLEELMSTGQQSLSAGNYAQAISDFQSAKELVTPESSDYDKVCFYLSKSYLLSGDSEKAETEFSSLTTLHPETPASDDLYYLFGKWYQDHGDYSQASTCLTRLVNQYTESTYRAKGYLYLMWVGFRTANTKLLNDSLAKVKQDYPGSPDEATALCQMARYDILKKKYDSAYSTYQSVLAHYPDYRWGRAECFKGLGEIKLHQGKYTEANAYFDQIKGMDINQTWNLLSDEMRVYSDTLAKHYPEAVTRLEQMLSETTDPNKKAQYLCTLGDVHLKAKQQVEAKQRFEEARTQYPSTSWGKLADKTLKGISQ